MFIKLTGNEDDRTVLVRSDQIRAISDQGDFTDVFMLGLDGWFRVKETPEQIMEMIKNA